MKRLLIVGPPGAGKGTQAANIVKWYNIPHISTGDMFRAALKNQTKMGLLAKTYMDKGELVPDDVTIGIVRERLMEDDCENGFLLDGFPRNLNQAKALDEMLKGMNLKLDYVINVNVPNEILTARIVGRRVCPNCGATYHIHNIKPLIEGICDICGSTLIQRKDDMLDTVSNRLDVYTKQTLPIIDYYQDILFNIDGTKSLNEVFMEIKDVLGNV